LAKAKAYASANVVNAIALGKGGAFAIDLSLEADVRLEGSSADITASNDFVALCVRKALAEFGSDSGASVDITSEIPIAKGLSSSSAVSNAVIAATAEALGEHLPALAVAEIAARASIEAGVSITGAFDDAAASYIGGGFLTDNLKMQVKKTFELPDYRVVLAVPEKSVLTSSVPVERMRLLKPVVSLVWDLAFSGKLEEAMLLNGLAYSAALGYDTRIIVDCLAAGARSASISGKGPAVAALAEKNKAKDVVSALKSFGGIYECALVRKRDDV